MLAGTPDLPGVPGGSPPQPVVSAAVPNSPARSGTSIRISPQVIDPLEFEARVLELLSHVDTASIDLDPPAKRSSPHPYIEAARRAELLHELWGTIVQPGIAATTGVRGRARRLVKRAIHKTTRWYVEQRWHEQHELDAEIARFATEAVLATRRTYLELRDARFEVDTLRRDLEVQRRALARNRADQAALLEDQAGTVRASIASVAEELTTARRELQASVERVEAVNRHVEMLEAETARGVEDVSDLSQGHVELRRLLLERASAGEVAKLRDETVQLMERLGVASAHGAEFDYVAFEDRFRGDSTVLAEAQADYVTKFPASGEQGLIVDVGCGRGEMLEVLIAAGHEVMGIDLDNNMVEVCRAKGLPVVKADGAAWLAACPSETLKGVFSAQVIEHLLTPEIERFIRASLAALRNGGVLVMETINPRSLHALANHFFADVSHVRPIHPETLRFMCEQAGFADVALMELSPHPAVAASRELGTAPLDDAVRQLVSSVFGFQDYAIVATKRI